jgi:predicted dienelactone hydrolase
VNRILKRALKIILVLVVILFAGGGYYLWRIWPRIPERPFVAPSGPYPVGTREYFWTDSTREEPYTRARDDRRRLVVQVWYPADATVRADTARYLLRPREFASRMGALAARRARTNSLLEAPLAPADSSYPVLVYHHGGAWTRWSATFTTEWLASHGYAVFSVEHFGFNQTTRFPDGAPFRPDTLAFPEETGDGKRDALASWAFLDDPVFNIWQADARFVLDRIEVLEREPGLFQGRLDLDRVGMFGWSFGGALAVQMTADDERVKAAVDHDGQLFGDVRERGTARPVMLMAHGVDDALAYPEEDRPVVRELMALVESWDSTTRERSTADWYQVKIRASDHGDFSDLALFYPRGEDRIAARRAHEIVNAYTLAFFDRYLRGRDSDLLRGEQSAFPEVTLRVWIRAAGRLARR